VTFEEYVSSRGPALVRLARLLTGDPHRAEDLTTVIGGIRVADDLGEPTSWD
jgi:DNA-directed RNA polymerase specialized sigma24 family protein